MLVYGVLFLDWGEMAGRDTKPFAGVRVWISARNVYVVWIC